MKVIFTSFFLLTFYTLLVAQVNPEQGLTGKVTGLNNSTDSSDIQVSFRCFQPKLSDTALLIVDGVLTKLNLLNQINPNDIESVTFLKSDAISTIYSCRPRKGVMVVTTKTALKREFVIKDFADSRGIAHATIQFTSGKDTLMFIANEQGIVSTDKLKQNTSYQVTISSVGYEPVKTIFENKTKDKKTWFLTADYKTGENVVVTGLFSIIRCYGIGPCNRVKKVNADLTVAAKNETLKIYPNPVTRGGAITIETNGKSIAHIRVLTLDGKMVYQSATGLQNDAARLTISPGKSWTAGIYVVQLTDANGMALRQEKIVLQ